MANELDVVELTRDLPAEGLTRGASGTVVFVHHAHPPLYVVEFSDENGGTEALVDLTEDDFDVVWTMPGPSAANGVQPESAPGAYPQLQDAARTQKAD